MRKILLLSFLTIAFVSSAIASQGFFQFNDYVGDAFANLHSIGSLTSSVDCVSTRDSSTFTGGSFAIREFDEAYLSKPSGEVWRRNLEGFNWTRTGVNSRVFTRASRWRNDNGAYDVWRWNNGLEDPRSCILLAESMVGLSQVATDSIGAIDCVRLESGGVRFWFDQNNSNRLIRFESDFGDVDAVAIQVDFLNWTDFGSGEFPTFSQTKLFSANGDVDAQWSYFHTNVEVGAPVDGSLFDLHIPTGIEAEEIAEFDDGETNDGPATGTGTDAMGGPGF
jgi:hypothetical protein